MPVSRPRPALPALGHATRRTTIIGASALALAGCRWGPDDTAGEDEGSAPEPATGDARVVEKAVDAIRGALSLVDLVQAKLAGLTIALGPLANTHRAHLVLLAVKPVPDRGGAVPGDKKEALRRIHRREAFLQRQLADFALEAASGDLARALASMSASVAQHVATIPELGRGPA